MTDNNTQPIEVTSEVLDSKTWKELQEAIGKSAARSFCSSIYLGNDRNGCGHVIQLVQEYASDVHGLYLDYLRPYVSEKDTVNYLSHLTQAMHPPSLDDEKSRELFSNIPLITYVMRADEVADILRASLKKMKSELDRIC